MCLGTGRKTIIENVLDENTIMKDYSRTETFEVKCIAMLPYQNKKY